MKTVMIFYVFSGAAAVWPRAPALHFYDHPSSSSTGRRCPRFGGDRGVRRFHPLERSRTKDDDDHEDDQGTQGRTEHA